MAQATLSTADRGRCQELVYGVVRWQATLDWLVARKTSSRAPKPPLQDLLRLGLYQLFWLERIPPHAAVHETVELAKRRGFGPQAGFVNALLRGYTREFEATRQLLAELRATQPALGYSHPDWLTERWHQRWGREPTAQLLAWNNTPPRTFARVNTLKVQPAELLNRWREENVEYDFVRRDWLEENLVFELKSHPPLGRLPSFAQGWFYVQDPSTLLAVQELHPQPGDTVLDLCAAPGGKLTCIAQFMRNDGQLIGYDTAPDRLKLVEENCARLGITCAKVTPQLLVGSPRRGDRETTVSAKPPYLTEGLRAKTSQPSHLPLFQKILVDAPCSNTGVMRRRVDLRWRLRREEIQRLRTIQVDLLRQAATLLRSGGTLVYSTCSLEPEENTQVVSEFLKDHPAFELKTERELRPFADRVDGAYVARLIRER